VLNAYLPVLCGVCEDDWAQRRTVHPHGFCGIIPERIFIESQKKKSVLCFCLFLFSFWDWILLLRSTRLYSYDPIKKLCRFIGWRGSNFYFFSLIFLFWFPLRARIFHHPIFTFLSLSLSNSFVLLSSSSNLHHPPAPRPLSSFSSLY
jgi:hypothetical protein